MRIVIVGDGKVGLALTQMLTAEDHDVTVVDSNPKVLERMQEGCDAMAVQGHGASRMVLQEAGADEADLLIAATSSDEINLLSCLIAKKLGCRHTIARVRNPEYADDLSLLREEMGLSFAVNPEEICAHEIFRLLQFPSFLGREQFAKGRVEIVRFRVKEGSPLADVPLFGLYKAARVQVLVCAVSRDGQVTIPNGSFVLRSGDDLFVTAATENLATLIKNLGLAARKVTQATIVGGSRLGLYLAHLLLKSGVGVKIIEKDPERCRFLSEQLPEADIVEGDGTEQEMLLAEGVDRSDALVSLTGIDEENIVLSMFARNLGMQTTITKCNRDQYTKMFRKMDIDTVVSPKISAAEQIVRYVCAMDNSVGSAMITLHYIADGQVEALEFHAASTSQVLGIPLAELDLKEGILIACISRGRTTIIPNGASTIQPGDLVVVVTAAGRRINELEDILA
ncbi:MAG: Trk system potassium transporter TrkA [Porticoccaceae bacterium]